jgi:hypothetical protein
MPMIIGLVAKRQSGKTLVANYLMQNYNYIKLSFASPLKNLVQNIFLFNDDQLFGNSKEIIDPYWKTSPRSLLQFIGTDLFRNELSAKFPDIGDNIWIKHMEKKLSQFSDNDKIIIDDVRFNNEIDMIKNFGGIIIKIDRYKNDDLLNDKYNMHQSETDLCNFSSDITISNNSSINDLYLSIDKLYPVIDRKI